jgi:hypothetical protein
MGVLSRFFGPRWLILGLIVAATVVGGLYLLSASRIQAAAQQPIAFNHELMVQAGVQCLFCHAEAMKSPVAGMPSVEKCMGCHKVIKPDSPEIVKLAGYWERQEPIPWARVNQLPRFVYFSHQVHVVAAGLNCEHCHGDVGHMDVARPVVKMDMGWCLDCHKQQDNAKQLIDCVVCHQ